MRWLVLGATGALGVCVVKEIERRGWTPVRAARSGAEENFDLADLDALNAALQRWSPDGVVNCAAIVDLPACEGDPARAYMINARPNSVLANWSMVEEAPLIYVSTDQYLGAAAGPGPHDEHAPIALINEYARTKYAGEAMALTAPKALAVRTNMASAWPGRGKSSFAAWTFDQLDARAPMTLFDDYYCSTIDAPTLATAMFDLVGKGAAGVVNVGSSDVFSKYELAHALAAASGITLDWASAGTAAALDPPRAIRVGLDVTKAEAILGRALPDLDGVARNFVAQRRAGP